jgi:hypothetical protein
MVGLKVLNWCVSRGRRRVTGWVVAWGSGWSGEVSFIQLKGTMVRCLCLLGTDEGERNGNGEVWRLLVARRNRIDGDI